MTLVFDMRRIAVDGVVPSKPMSTPIRFFAAKIPCVVLGLELAFDV
jgi:hypothetical protein